MRSRHAVALFRGVRHLPFEERPRERLRRRGAPALSNRELLALLVGSGSTRGSALDVADRLARDGVHALAGRSFVELERTPGLGAATAARILAAVELGTRLGCEAQPGRGPLRAPDEVARFLLPRYGVQPVETFGMLALDARHQLKGETVVSIGTLTASLVHPREVFREAVVQRAAAIIVFHNHPSGDPEPSAEDLALTRRLKSAGELLGIELLDHLILAAGRFVSLKERGMV